MNDQQLLRYSRHLLLPQIDVEGQSRLLAAHALVIGAGGLGSPAALYLAAAGFGRITLADGDTVDLTNLQRQIVHTTARIGQNKAESARVQLQAINPDITIEIVTERLEGDRLHQMVGQADVVLDCSDNFTTRHAVNRACVALKTPLVSGAAIVFDGQLAVFDPRQPDSPCYHCLFPETAQSDELRCSETGIFAPLTGIVGCLQAAEAIKLVAGCGRPMTGRLMLINGLDTEWRTLRISRDPGCPVCGTAQNG